ncbi:hypothetical protein F5B18DRAFT_622290 [Nemania serpens]|nr:hypothetical protein F5B18DRAFT_622290 [Nemania serpens]
MAGKKQPAPPKSTSSKGRAATKPANSPRSPPSKTQKPSRATEAVNESEEELGRQQTLLDVFGTTFRDVLGADDFGAQLREVKAALFNRDFGGAFAREAALDVYAARWSPTRALCYGRVLRRLDARLQGLVVGDRPACADHARRKDRGPEGEIGTRKGGDGHDGNDEHVEHARDKSAREDHTRNVEVEDQEPQEASVAAAKQTKNQGKEGEVGGGGTRTLRVLAIGGAAAEIVAFADYISALNTNASASATARTRGEITLLDIGPWGTVVQRLQTALTTPPPTSPYARSAAAVVNRALVPPEYLRSAFLQRDILSLEKDELAALLSANPNTDEPEPVLVTLLFTLNELYTTSGTRRTTAFLRLLSALVAPGSLLLVVDSPGSYAEAAVGRDARRYPMQWLLDHTLVPPAPASRAREDGGESLGADGGGGIRWEKLESHDSVWFRVADGLRYPIPLENMRYQMHLYRACVR